MIAIEQFGMSPEQNGMMLSYIGVISLFMQAKSLYRNCAGSQFFGTEYEIWADFGPVGNTEKKRWVADCEQLLREVFSCFQGQIFFLNFFENTIASALKSCIIDLKKYFFLFFLNLF